MAKLKAVLLTYFSLDPTPSYSRWQKHESVSLYILERVKAMNEKGKIFRQELRGRHAEHSRQPSRKGHADK